MKFTVKSMNDWLYHDSVVADERHEIKLSAVRGGSAGFQILFEDHELLKALTIKDKPLADSICSTVFRAFDDCDNDAAVFDSVHDKLIEACAQKKI